MTPPPPRKDSATMDAEVREKIHLEILKRTGAYHANDHILLPSGQHTTEYIEKTLVTTEPSFTEGLGAVIAKHFAPWPIDVVVSTGPGALILSHCVARAHPSRPTVMYGTKGVSGGQAARDAPGRVSPAHPPGDQGARGGGPRELRRDGAAAHRARREPGRQDRRRRRPLAPDQARRGGRQDHLQPREPRLPDVSARGLSPLQARACRSIVSS